MFDTAISMLDLPLLLAADAAAGCRRQGSPRSVDTRPSAECDIVYADSKNSGIGH